MGRYYCEFCDIYLTHDSQRVRRDHRKGKKHIIQVQNYFSSLPYELLQFTIDRINQPAERGYPHPPPKFSSAQSMISPNGGAPGFGQMRPPLPVGMRPPPPTYGRPQFAFRPPPQFGRPPAPHGSNIANQPPGMGSKFPPPGMGSNFQPLGRGPNFPPPGMGSNFPPPGMGSNSPPPGMGSNFHPPGMGSNFHPPGMVMGESSIGQEFPSSSTDPMIRPEMPSGVNHPPGMFPPNPSIKRFAGDQVEDNSIMEKRQRMSDFDQ